MPTNPFGLAGPTFQTRDPFWLNERCVNWLPTVDASNDAKSKVALMPCPGLTAFAEPGGIISPPIRGLMAGDGRLFAVSDTHFLEISSGGTITDRGFISGGQTPVQFAASGTSVLIASGNRISRDGGTGITTALDGAISVAYLDGYYAALMDGSGDPADANSIILDSNVPNTVDGVSFDPGVVQKINGPADRGTFLIVHEGHLWIFCSRSIHVWYNTGADFPFAPIQGTDIDIGTDYPWTIAQIDMHLYFLGFDRRGQGRVYRTQGYTPVRISNESIEYLIDSYLRLGVDPVITGYGYEEDRHSFYVLSFPKAKACLVYDIATDMWHERASWRSGAWDQWRGAGYHAFVFGKHYVARACSAPFDADARRIFVQDVMTPTDDTLPIRRLRAAPYLQAKSQWLFHHCLRLHTDATVPVDMRYFTDKKTWSATRSASAVKDEIQYWRLGRDRNRLYEVSLVTGAERPMISEAWVNASPGVER